jgi:hypothetical protein
LFSTHRHQDCGNQKEDNSRDSLLITSRGVSGGLSGITGYQPTFFESKQLIPDEKTASDFGKKRLCHLGSGGKRNNILMYIVIYIIFYLSSYFN